MLHCPLVVCLLSHTKLPWEWSIHSSFSAYQKDTLEILEYLTYKSKNFKYLFIFVLLLVPKLCTLPLKNNFVFMRNGADYNLELSLAL